MAFSVNNSVSYRHVFLVINHPDQQELFKWPLWKFPLLKLFLSVWNTNVTFSRADFLCSHPASIYSTLAINKMNCKYIKYLMEGRPSRSAVLEFLCLTVGVCPSAWYSIISLCHIPLCIVQHAGLHAVISGMFFRTKQNGRSERISSGGFLVFFCWNSSSVANTATKMAKSMVIGSFFPWQTSFLKWR